MIISIQNQKGGVGKTTLAIHISHALALRDEPMLQSLKLHVVIDGPPRVTDLARSVIAAADLVLIPVQPSPYNVWAAQEVINLIQEASVFKEKLKSVFVINCKITNAAIGRDVAEALSGYSAPVL